MPWQSLIISNAYTIYTLSEDNIVSQNPGLMVIRALMEHGHEAISAAQ